MLYKYYESAFQTFLAYFLRLLNSLIVLKYYAYVYSLSSVLGIYVFLNYTLYLKSILLSISSLSKLL